ncbi:MAG: hypothetical protein WAN74_03260 [Thermoplasmata archaeon]
MPAAPTAPFPSPSGTPDLDALGPPVPPPSSSRRRAQWTAVGAVVVVVVLVVGGLFWLGVFSSGSASGISTNPPYSSALGAASSTVHGASGGPWTIVAGVGIALASNVTEPATNISNEFDTSGCIFAWQGAPPTLVTFPATPAQATPGTAGAWAFVSTNPSLSALVTVVTDAGAVNLFTISGSCAADFALLSSLPGNAVDSTHAAASANTAGGTTFLIAHPEAARVYAIAAAGPLAFWDVTYSTCPLISNPNATGLQFNLTEYASTGTPVTPGSTGTVSCSAGPIP